VISHDRLEEGHLTGVRLVTSDAHARADRGDRRDPARRVLAAVPHPLRGQPHVRDPEGLVAVGEGAAALGLRPARRRVRARPVQPRRSVGVHRTTSSTPRLRRAPRTPSRRCRLDALHRPGLLPAGWCARRDSNPQPAGSSRPVRARSSLSTDIAEIHSAATGLGHGSPRQSSRARQWLSGIGGHIGGQMISSEVMLACPRSPVLHWSALAPRPCHAVRLGRHRVGGRRRGR
jgi:hypothetical protein